MKLRMTSVVLSLLLMSSVILMPRSAVAQVTNQVSNIPVTGSGPGGNRFVGSLDITDFTVQNGVLVAVGRLNGNVLSRTGQILRRVSNLLISLPVIIGNSTCTILDLELGPLDLNLLGLRIQLDEVDLLITADPTGGLLGALLCAIANLLNTNPGNLLGLAGLLDQLLGLLP